MVVNIRLFASYADATGRDVVSVTLTSGATVGDAVAALRALPGCDVLPARPLTAVNHSYAKLSDPIAEADEIALIPPVAGG